MTHEPDTDGRAEVLLIAEADIEMDFISEARLHANDMQPVIQRDYLFAAIRKLEANHAQALAAGYASVAEWVAAKDAEIARKDEILREVERRLAEIYTGDIGPVLLRWRRATCARRYEAGQLLRWVIRSRQALAGDA